ncbi:MAG: TIGR01212 family radical SAM protein [Candidatus Sumerlaeia bacterium]
MWGRTVEPMNTPLYNSFSRHLRERFGCRVHRVALDAGFACPNRDGTKGRGGCLYCDADGSRADYVEPSRSIREQMELGMERMARRFGARRFIAYFQAFTNTYAPVQKLRALYEQALFDPDRIVGLSVGTRPDCLTAPVLDLLEEFHARTYLWVELGLESANQATLDAHNRADSVERFIEAACAARRRGLRVAAHVIAGFPTDGPEDFLHAARLINECGVSGVKLHNLFISRRAPLARLFEKRPFALLTREQYIGLVCDFLAVLDPQVLIHRLMGEARPGDLIGPAWCLDKAGFLGALEGEMRRRGIVQGINFEKAENGVRR